MLTSPYSIYVNKRPLRVAFLVEDKPDSIAAIDAVLAYNRDRWGGRYNPIVLTDGRTLTDTWWSFLEAVDPDVVKSFVTLSDDLIGAIEHRVSPYLIQQPDPREQGYDGLWRICSTTVSPFCRPHSMCRWRAGLSVSPGSCSSRPTGRRQTR